MRIFAAAALIFVLCDIAAASPRGQSSTARAMIEMRPTEGMVDPMVSPAVQMVTAIFNQFFARFMPDQSGARDADSFESSVEGWVSRIGNSRFHIALEGAGNLRYLGRHYFYSEHQGGIGIQYNFTSPDDPSTLFALRISPLYGEIAMIRTAEGSPAERGLPAAVGLGLSAGLEAAQTWGPVTGGMKIYARPQVEITGSGASGVALYSSVYFRFLLRDFGARNSPLAITTSLSYHDRGGALSPAYDWRGLSPRGLGIRHVVQGMVMLEWRY